MIFQQAVSQIQDCANKLHSGIALEGIVIAARVDDKQYTITEPGVCLTDISRENTLIQDSEAPESLNSPVHAVFQRSLKTLFAIWAQSPFSDAVAQSYKRIPPVLDDMAQVVSVSARVVDAADETSLHKALAKGGACIVKNSIQGAGLLAAGTNPAHVAAALLVLEKSAKVFWEAQFLGGAEPINRVEAWFMHRAYKQKYSQMESKASHQTLEDLTREIPPSEMAARQEMVKVGLQLLERNLVQGTWGNISVRLDDQFMLVTPSGLEYDLLTPCDMVRVDMHTLAFEGRLNPTSEKLIHAELLKAKADVRCIIHTHPVNGSVFAAAHSPLVVADEADRKLLGGDVAVAEYGPPGSKRLAKAVINAIQGNKACLMKNHGILVCGASIEDTLEKCETLERLAGSQINKLITHLE